MNASNDYALITGASHGIGRSIAIELSRRNHNVLLVALDTKDLHDTKAFIIANYKTKVDVFGVDLTNQDAAENIYDWCSKNKYNINILVNNAGFGEGGYFEDTSLERYRNMIDLNNKAYVSLTYKFLPDMKRRRNCHIMNTSSMEATLPLPYKSVYTGTKHFIYAFSLALNEEIRKFGVKLTVLCPGPVLTNDAANKRFKSQGAKAKLLVITSDRVAKVGVKHMLRGKIVSNPGKMNWWVVKIARFFPLRLKMKILERIFSAYK